MKAIVDTFPASVSGLTGKITVNFTLLAGYNLEPETAPLDLS